MRVHVCVGGCVRVCVHAYVGVGVDVLFLSSIVVWNFTPASVAVPVSSMCHSESVSPVISTADHFPSRAGDRFGLYFMC